MVRHCMGPITQMIEHTDNIRPVTLAAPQPQTFQSVQTWKSSVLKLLTPVTSLEAICQISQLEPQKASLFFFIYAVVLLNPVFGM